VNEEKALEGVRVDPILGREAERLQRLAVAMGLSASEGQDMLQDVYIKVLEQPPRISETGQAARWLMRVMVNRCILEFRRKRRHEHKVRDIFEQAAARKRPQVGPDQQMIRAEETGAVRRALTELSELLRVPLVLKYYCGLNASEIGAILELKPGTVRKRLCDGRIVLAKVLLRKGIKP
jgi:RNA polymerase sigma-70 factor (ECF subfamily)